MHARLPWEYTTFMVARRGETRTDTLSPFKGCDKLMYIFLFECVFHGSFYDCQWTIQLKSDSESVVRRNRLGYFSSVITLRRLFQIFLFKRFHQSRDECRKRKLNLMHENRSDSESIYWSVPPASLQEKKNDLKKIRNLEKLPLTCLHFLLFRLCLTSIDCKFCYVEHINLVIKAITVAPWRVCYICPTCWHGHCASKCRTSLYVAASTWRLDGAFGERVLKVFLSDRSVTAIRYSTGKDYGGGMKIYEFVLEK